MPRKPTTEIRTARCDNQTCRRVMRWSVPVGTPKRVYHRCEVCARNLWEAERLYEANRVTTVGGRVVG